MKNKNLFNGKGLKTFGTLLRNKAISAEVAINHPGRNQNLQYYDHHCTAATPPSKGGENNIN